MITAADAAFAAQDWDNATAKYTEASALKPKEKYPTDQLAAITTRKAEAAKKAEEERKQRELDERYNAAIAEADKAFEKEKWEEAKTKYTEASGVKPPRAYPKDQLALIVAGRSRQRLQEAGGIGCQVRCFNRHCGCSLRQKGLHAAKSKYQKPVG